MQATARPIRFREITPEDVPALFQVRSATDENTLSREQLQALGITEASVLERLAGSYKGWLCESAGEVVGFAMGDAATGELWVIAVLPAWIRHGIGGALLAMVEAWLFSQGCRKLWLTTDVDTQLRAYSFYRNRGWQDDTVREGLRYMKKLPGEKRASVETAACAAGATLVQEASPTGGTPARQTVKPQVVPAKPVVLKHSGLGIASFVLSLLFGGAMFLAICLAGLVYARHGGQAPQGSMDQLVVGLAIIGFSMLDIVALGLGVGGLFQQDRRKLFAVLGIVFSSITLLLVAGLMIIGVMSNA